MLDCDVHFEYVINSWLELNGQRAVGLECYVIITALIICFSSYPLS